MKTLCFILLSCILLSSCGKKNEDEPANNPGSGSTEKSLTGTLDDTTFKADYFQSSYPGPLLQLYGFETSTSRAITLVLNNKDAGVHTMTLDLYGTSASCQGSGGTTGYNTIHGAGHGSINVTSSSANKVSGTFSFVGYNLAGTDSAEVAGTFNNFDF